MKMSFHPHADKTHFHMRGFARGFALKKRHKTIRKWPIWLQLILSLVNKCLFNLSHVTSAHKVYIKFIAMVTSYLKSGGLVA